MSAIAPETNMFERLGLSYLLGVGLVTLLTFYLSWLGLKITSNHILAIVAVLIVSSYLLCLKLKREIHLVLPNFRKIFLDMEWYERAVLFIILFVFGLSFVLMIYYPVNAWDALALYDFRAKIMASLGYFVQIQGNFTYFSQYPLLTSLTHTIVYLFGGNNPQFTYPFYLISFALLVFSLARKDVGRFVAMATALFIVTNPETLQNSLIAYTNLPYTVFYVIGVIYLYKAVKDNKNVYIFLSALLIGLSTWVRADEPFWLTGAIVIIIYSIYKKSLIPSLVYFPIFLLIQQPWSIYAAHLFGQSYSTTGQLTLVGKSVLSGVNFGRILDVTIFIYKNVVLSWGFISAAFLIAIIVDIKNKFSHYRLIMLSIIIINLLGLIAGTYIFSLEVSGWKDIPDSALRLAMFFPPLMIYYVGLVFAAAFKKQK